MFDVMCHSLPSLLTAFFAGGTGDQTDAMHQLDPFSIVVAGTARMAEVVLFQMTHLMHQRREYLRSVSLLKVCWVERNLVCDLRCVPEGRDHLVGASPTRAMVGWPGSWQAVRSGNRQYRSPATNVALGGGANRRAVTRVKPEQASKGKLWTPTRPELGEGSTIWGSSRQTHLDRSTGVMGTARRDRGSRKRGRPVLGEGSGLNGAVGRRFVRESDRVVVPDEAG